MVGTKSKGMLEDKHVGILFFFFFFFIFPECAPRALILAIAAQRESRRVPNDNL